MAFFPASALQLFPWHQVLGLLQMPFSTLLWKIPLFCQPASAQTHLLDIISRGYLNIYSFCFHLFVNLRKYLNGISASDLKIPLFCQPASAQTHLLDIISRGYLNIYSFCFHLFVNLRKYLTGISA